MGNNLVLQQLWQTKTLQELIDVTEIIDVTYEWREVQKV